MDANRGDPGGWVPLPKSGEPRPAERARAGRDGLRQARRVSNWTAAALIVGSGTAAVALAHQAFPAAAPAAAGALAGAGAPAGALAAGAPAAGGPQVTHSVATTSASGVTTITTTHTVNGKTVVTQVRTGHPRGDN